jgi:uncharacterized membrane protein YfhO
VDAPAATRLLVRDAWARGWSATVDGRKTELLPHRGHRAVALDAGRHQVELTYGPPGLRPGLALSVVSTLLLAFLFRRAPRV